MAFLGLMNEILIFISVVTCSMRIVALRICPQTQEETEKRWDIVHTCNPNTQVVEAGESSRVEDQPRLHRETLSQNQTNKSIWKEVYACSLTSAEPRFGL
jgi:hypothetical protein